MVVKQEIPVKCLCGQALEFPDGQIKLKCQCGVVWKLSLGGRWEVRKVPFVTLLIYLKKRDLNHYQRFMRWRLGRAGSKC
ncbi:hypothetical protein DEAC_c17330 [Desulfosporosinus acididurans]|uniref:Uncharacterized protein n=1 Tax=Desulfosporosinus acididurans TaxID=476652 RepID=A0A0J1FS83_9FIRM|nr:hypothetical protein [Desulfosporosinus acididurans]KLU66334.1 hypothetical protein DEAC_c17330 [Desulfosporosinus acididurans]